LATASSRRSSGPRRTSIASSTTDAQAIRTPRGSARDRAGALQAADLVLDQFEVFLRELVDVALEGERPVLRRPLAHVLQPVGEVLGRQPLTVLQHSGRLDPDAPRVLLVTAGAAPDVRVVLEDAGGERAGGREDHPAGHVEKQAVTGLHHLGPLAMAALDALDGEPSLLRLAVVLERADDHPVPGGSSRARGLLLAVLTRAAGQRGGGGPGTWGDANRPRGWAALSRR